jgi:hypothetical protein
MPDCDNLASARGLCAKHYMRARRNGDPAVVRKRGPTPDATSIAGIVRSLFEDQSRRPQARQIRAMTLDRKLQEHLGADEHFTKAVMAASRPNGSLNVAKLLRIMERRAAMLLAELPP